MSRFQLLVLSLFFIAMLSVACGAHRDERGYPANGPSYLDSGELQVPLTLEGLAKDADLIAVVEPIEKVGEVWNATETFVSSRFSARVVRVLKGDVQPDAQILLYAPGGTVRDPFAANESRKPDGTGNTTVEQYVDWPFFIPGKQEFVFLKLVTPAPDTGVAPFYWNLGPSARFALDGDRLESIYPKGVEVEDFGGVRALLAGSTIDEVAAKISAATSN